MNNNADCPVDFITVNENKVRIVAFFVLLSVIAYLITSSWIVAAILAVDFLLRTLNFNAYSPYGIVAGEIAKLFKLPNKPVDRAPKRFAAFTGLLFSVALLITSLVQLTETSEVIGGVLIIFAALEAFVGFCAGCYMYSLLKRLNIIRVD